MTTKLRKNKRATDGKTGTDRRSCTACQNDQPKRFWLIIKNAPHVLHMIIQYLQPVESKKKKNNVYCDDNTDWWMVRVTITENTYARIFMVR